MGLKPSSLPQQPCAPAICRIARFGEHSAMSFSYSPTFFQHFPKYHAPHLKPGEEAKDPAEEIKPKCLAQCSSWLMEYNHCVERINFRTDGKGNCQGQYEELAMCQ